MKNAPVFGLLLTLCSLQAFAADPLPANTRDAPVEITADKSLEWDREKKTYTARGNAVAQQGAMQVKSATLTAHYSENNSGAASDAAGTEITQLEATGNVEISSPPYTAYGDQAVYDLSSGIATLRGENLRIETPTENLTAKNHIEFDSNQNRMSAVGGATAIRGTDSVTADTLNAFFAADAQGKTGLQRITADTPVIIKTARETITGNSGVYDLGAGKATLEGKVRILQGQNWLEGTRAEVDLNTGVSKLYGRPAAGTKSKETVTAGPPLAPVGDGRARAVFFPKKKTPETKAP